MKDKSTPFHRVRTGGEGGGVMRARAAVRDLRDTVVGKGGRGNIREAVRGNTKLLRGMNAKECRFSVGARALHI